MPILREEDIPGSLWAQSTLFMPLCLAESYAMLLHQYGVMDMALRLDDVSGPVGGRGREETLKHFAMRFGVCATRGESIVLDPKVAFKGMADNLITCLSDGSVSILDVPCGCGALGGSLLSTIAVLRSCSVLPKEPLDISITGGDCSQTALDVYNRMINELVPAARAVGINVKLNTQLWDATDRMATAALVDNWFNNSVGCEEYLVVIANISGEASRRFDDFERSFQHIQERINDKQCTMIWIEPEMHSSPSYFARIARLLQVGRGSAARSAPQPLMSHTYDWHHPFQKRRLPCRVLVYRYERP